MLNLMKGETDSDAVVKLTGWVLISEPDGSQGGYVATLCELLKCIQEARSPLKVKVGDWPACNYFSIMFSWFL